MEPSLQQTKNPHAQSLGSLGGKKRAENLSKERRLEISKKANEAKAKKKVIRMR